MENETSDEHDDIGRRIELRVDVQWKFSKAQD
jgi:hypothetical protein